MRAGLGLSRVSSAGLVLVGLLITSGCSGGAKPSASNGPVTVTVVQTPSDSPSSTLSDSGDSTSDSVSPTDTATGSADAGGSATDTLVIDPPRHGVPLALANFFEPDNVWSEGSENIADRKGLQGIFAEISSCGNYSRELELRLEDNYKSLSFSVGQANNSRNINQTLTVAVQANGSQVAIKNIPFNKLQNFTVPVTSVNALQIQFYLDSQNPNCGGSVVAVLYNAVLS